MVGLLGDVGLEWLEVEFVAAAAELVGVVVFDAYASGLMKTVEAVEAESVEAEFAYFRESVAVVVVWRAVAVALEE